MRGKGGRKKRDVSVGRSSGGGNKGEREVPHEATMRERNILKREIKMIAL